MSQVYIGHVSTINRNMKVSVDQPIHNDRYILFKAMICVFVRLVEYIVRQSARIQ